MPLTDAAITLEDGNAATSDAAIRIERTRRRVGVLRLYERNPRRISRDRMKNLMRSLAEDPSFLEARPLIVNTYPGREDVVVAGNMRLRAAIMLGWSEIPVILVSLPPETESAWNIKDNNEWGDWVDADLAALLAELGARGVALDLLGFDPKELERLLALAVAIPADADAFDPTPPAISESRPGDLYLLGSHRLVCGDSRDPAVWDLLMSPEMGALADALWTDPPYGIDLADAALPSRSQMARTAIAGDLENEVPALLRAVFAQATAICAPALPSTSPGPEAGWAPPSPRRSSAPAGTSRRAWSG